MTTRRRNDGRQLPGLAASRDDVQKALEERVVLGKGLRDAQVTTRVELEQARREFERWTDYNRELLTRLFDQDTIAEEYTGVRWASYNSVPQRWRYNIVALRRDFDARITKLESILDRLPLIDGPNRQVQPVAVEQAAGKKTGGTLSEYYGDSYAPQGLPTTLRLMIEGGNLVCADSSGSVTFQLPAALVKAAVFEDQGAGQAVLKVLSAAGSELAKVYAAREWATGAQSWINGRFAVL